jgi:predicted enzyme related to lactoylglutathione lyase
VVDTISLDGDDAFVAKTVAAEATGAVPRRAVAGSGWLTYLADPAGILFGIMQHDEAAK